LIVAPEPALAPVMLPVIVPIVQAKLLAIEAVKLIFVLVPLQITAVFAVVTTGPGFTVMVIVKEGPVHEPDVVMGVTIYSTEPVNELLGLVSVWLMVDPELALAPVIPPVIAPIVQAKLLGALDVKVIFGPVPLQMLAVGELVTIGVGLTVTVIVYAAPAHEPVVEVGVTIYSTVPATALLGLVSDWLMVVPEPALAPVMPPVITPIVQAKLLGALDVKVIFGPVPLQVLTVAGLVTVGIGLTVTAIVYAAPAHEPVVEVGVTIYCTVPPVTLLGLFSIWLIVAPEPALAPVMLPVIVPIIQVKLLGADAVKLIFGLTPLQIVAVVGVVTTGTGLIVTVIVKGVPGHEPVVEVGVIM
jgi:uncharacterized protein Usg